MDESLPKMLGRFQRIDFESFPPLNLIPGLMKLPMMPATERHRKFVADLKTHGSRFEQTADDAGSLGCRPQTRQGWDATNFRCALSRSRLGLAIVSWLLSIRDGTKADAVGASGGAAGAPSSVFTS